MSTKSLYMIFMRLYMVFIDVVEYATLLQI